MRLWLLVCLILVPISAAAQTIDSYQAKYYNAGAPSPVQTESFPVSAASCNQAPPVITSTVNPSRVVWDDPANPGKVCIYSAAPSGPLFSIPVGNYEGTLTAINAAGASAESARVPFSRLAVPPVPTGVRVNR